MPSGKTHAAWSGALTVTCGAAYGVAWVVGMEPVAPLEALAMMAGLVTGILITPDIDMAQVTHEEKRLSKIPLVGWLIKGLWGIYWRAYCRGIKHRSPLSHEPLRSTLIRVAYLCYLWLPLLFFFPHWPWYLAPYLLIGWVAQDTLHIVLDAFGGRR